MSRRLEILEEHTDRLFFLSSSEVYEEAKRRLSEQGVRDIVESFCAKFDILPVETEENDECYLAAFLNLVENTQDLPHKMHEDLVERVALALTEDGGEIFPISLHPLFRSYF